MKNNIKILHIVSALDAGGVESMLYNYYLNINNKKILFDFIVHDKKVGMLEENFEKMDCKIFHVTPKKESLYRNIRDINKIIKANKYNIVHVHQNFSSATSLLIAKYNNVPVRICHSHGCKEFNCFEKILNEGLLRTIISMASTHKLACNYEAMKWLYGSKKAKSSQIMYNAIDCDKFKEIAKKSNVEKDNIVLLHVGRFSDEKNHIFLINIVDELVKLNKYNIELLCVGEGALKEKIQVEVKMRGLENNIHLLGKKNDVNEIMNISDIFILPSKHEGLPLTLIEAQMSGIKVISSDRVSKESKISNLIHYYSLDNTAKEWAKKIIEVFESEIINKNIDTSKYNIKLQAKNYEDWIIANV